MNPQLNDHGLGFFCEIYIYMNGDGGGRRAKREAEKDWMILLSSIL